MQSVNFIYKKYITFLDICEDARQVTCFFNLWAGCGVKLGAGSVRNDISQRSFTESRRAGE
jgi:hypothetical protein